jgi:hypothetical protein
MHILYGTGPSIQVNGVWSMVTLGDDALWVEMAELAALRGAQLHCHLCCHQNMRPAEALLHDQIIANMARFRTLAVVGSPLRSGLDNSGDYYFLGSGAAVWDDLEVGKWCAVKIRGGRPWEKVFSAPRIAPGGDWVLVIERPAEGIGPPRTQSK